MTIETNPISRLKNLNLSKYPIDEINSKLTSNFLISYKKNS